MRRNSQTLKVLFHITIFYPVHSVANVFGSERRLKPIRAIYSYRRISKLTLEAQSVSNFKYRTNLRRFNMLENSIDVAM